MKNLILKSRTIVLVFTLFACKNTDNKVQTRNETPSVKGSFGDDLAFLKKHKSLLVLQATDNLDAQVMVIDDKIRLCFNQTPLIL